MTAKSKLLLTNWQPCDHFRPLMTGTQTLSNSVLNCTYNYTKPITHTDTIHVPYELLLGLIWHSATKATAKLKYRWGYFKGTLQRCSHTRNLGWAWEDHFLTFFSFLYYFSHFSHFPLIFFLNLVLTVGKVTIDAVATVIVHALAAAYAQSTLNSTQTAVPSVVLCHMRPQSRSQGI